MVIGWTNLSHLNAFVKYFLKPDPSYCMQIVFGVLQKTRVVPHKCINKVEQNVYQYVSELSLVIWDLFDIWDLTNFIWETKVRPDQSEFYNLHVGPNTKGPLKGAIYETRS